jgi:magnesium transporter
MTKQLKYKNITWIDLESPTKEELKSVVEKYKIHTLVATELSAPSARSKVDVYDDYIYSIFHFPPCEVCVGNKNKDAHQIEELDFVLGQDFLITVHYTDVPQLEELSKILETQFDVIKSRKEPHAGHLLFYIIRTIYHSLNEGLEYINLELKEAEQKVFSGHEKEMVSTLSIINRKLIDFRWTIKSHNEILSSLEIAVEDFFEPKFKFYIKTLQGEFERLWNMLESNRETFSDIRLTNESLLNIKTNEIMKNLTIMAFMVLPMALIASTFGMSLDIPLNSNPNSFWIVISLMIIAGGTTYGFIKYKRWL